MDDRDDGEVVDELPADLQPSEADEAAYEFPNNNRRRKPGILYLAVAIALVVLWVFRADGGVLVNSGYLIVAAILAAAGIFHLVSGIDLNLDEEDALVAATAAVGFPVGHAAGQMGWRGLLSRPTWRILLYSADEPPTKRGLVFVDGHTGDVVDSIIEDNPEDWSDVGPLTASGESVPESVGDAEVVDADDPTELAEAGESSD